MSKIKLMTILGTRPEIIRLCQTIKACDSYFDNILVHTGQNYDYELNEIFFKDLNLRVPDYYLSAVGQNLGETMGNIISKTYALIEMINPDAVLILGDTNSALSAISAKRLKCPIFHMEAGNRCWDWNVSEMINRKIVDHISDINLPYTEHARRYLLSEGIDGKTIFVTGSPMREVIDAFFPKIENSSILTKLKLTPKQYIVVSSHREENIDNEDNFNKLMTSINAVAEKYQISVIFSTHPRTLKTIKMHDFKFSNYVRIIKPLGFTDYLKLQKNSLLVLSDSGTLTEESAILDFPAVLIRTSTERPEGIENGRIIIGGIETKNILQAAEIAISQTKIELLELPLEYSVKNVSEKIVKIIQSYTSIVNQTTWMKK